MVIRIGGPVAVGKLNFYHLLLFNRFTFLHKEIDQSVHNQPPGRIFEICQQHFLGSKNYQMSIILLLVFQKHFGVMKIFNIASRTRNLKF